MFAVIYRFKLKAYQEAIYQDCWNKVATYFIEKRGAIGSCLHKGSDGLWVAYSRWPDKQTRDASWPAEDRPASDLSYEIKEALKIMLSFKEENTNLEQYDEICLDVINDKLAPRI